jgi:signal peptidase I
MAEPDEGTRPEPTASRKRSARGCLVEIVETILLTALIFFGIQTFVAQPYRVEGTSMAMTVLPDQYVLIDKLTPRWAPYARGDIVVLNPPADYPGSSGVPFIKRVIGLPGDRVALKDGIVTINGVALDEPYIYTANGVPQRTDPTLGDTSAWVVPAGQLFVMGDHRGASADSRVFGPVDVSRIIGRAWLRYLPVDAFGILPTASYAGIPAPTQTVAGP